MHHNVLTERSVFMNYRLDVPPLNQQTRHPNLISILNIYIHVHLSTLFRKRNNNVFFVCFFLVKVEAIRIVLINMTEVLSWSSISQSSTSAKTYVIIRLFCWARSHILNTPLGSLQLLCVLLKPNKDIIFSWSCLSALALSFLMLVKNLLF